MSNHNQSIFLYPIIALTGVIGAILTFVSSLEAIVATLGLAISLILIGIGVLGWFVSQEKISLGNGIQYSIIWTLVILLAGVGYYLIMSRPVAIIGSLMDNSLNRNPMTSYEVQLYNYQTGITSTVRTDIQGNFRFGDVGEGEYDLIINGVTVRSERASSGIQKLVQGDISAGRFYLNSLSTGVDVVLSPTETPIIPTHEPTAPATSTNTTVPTATDTPLPTSTSTITLTSTPRPTNTARPTNTNTPTATAVPQELILFEEDFESGNLRSANSVTGLWIVIQEDNNYILEGGHSQSQSVISFGSQNWQDVSIELQFKPINFIGPSHDQFEICVRCHSVSTQGYTFKIMRDGGIFWDKILNGHYQRVTESRTILNRSDWNNLSIEIIDSRIRTLINGSLVISDVLDVTYVSGGISILVEPGLQIQFDNIRIWSLD